MSRTAVEHEVDYLTEAIEVHDYLDRKGIPTSQVDLQNGQVYYMYLLDRVLLFKDLG